MAINFFTHPSISSINEQLKPLTQSMRSGDTIKAIHTPIVLPLNTSNEIGGYACSLGLPFGPKRIAIDCDRLLKEDPSMRKFILARQIALFDKPSRYLHLPMAAVAIGIAFIASSVLFPCSILAAVTIPAIVGIANALIIAKKERDNELYADLKAFRNCEIEVKREVYKHFFYKTHQIINIHYWMNPIEGSLIRQIFCGSPLNIDRYEQLNEEVESLNDDSILLYKRIHTRLKTSFRCTLFRVGNQYFV